MKGDHAAGIKTGYSAINVMIPIWELLKNSTTEILA